MTSFYNYIFTLHHHFLYKNKYFVSKNQFACALSTYTRKKTKNVLLSNLRNISQLKILLERNLTYFSETKKLKNIELTNKF